MDINLKTLIGKLNDTTRAAATRAAELGGELVVESEPGGPTAVSVAVPVDECVEDSVDGDREPGGRINRKIEEEE